MEIKRKLASIQRISAIAPISGADKIEVATVLGWECVVKKDEFKVGDLCVYFEIDSILPPYPVFAFMEERKYRVKTIKLRKQISQGLALQLKVAGLFFKGTKGQYCDPSSTFYEEKICASVLKDFEEGDDVTDLIGVTKYEPLEPGVNQVSTKLPKNPIVKYMFKFSWFIKLYFFIMPRRVKGTFPSFIPKTDEERIQSKPSILFKNIGACFYNTEKLDGSSATYFFNKNLLGKKFGLLPKSKETGFGVCSRNLRLPTDNGSIWWKIAKKYDLDTKLKEFCLLSNINIAIQGEIIGPNIQKNKYQLTEIDFFVFSIFNIDTQKYLSYADKFHICYLLGLKCVPKLDTFRISAVTTVKTLIALATIKSAINAKIDAEGIVCRRADDDRISFKVINPNFLLKNDE